MRPLCTPSTACRFDDLWARADRSDKTELLGLLIRTAAQRHKNCEVDASRLRPESLSPTIVKAAQSLSKCLNLRSLTSLSAKSTDVQVRGMVEDLMLNLAAG